MLAGTNSGLAPIYKGLPLNVPLYCPKNGENLTLPSRIYLALKKGRERKIKIRQLDR